MEGLAQSMAGSPAQPVQPEQVDPAMLQQIVELLMNGADPEDLVKQGIPPEVIMQAIDMLEQQLASQGQGQAQAPVAAPAGPQGLAQAMV
jgi:hypothetical protein